MNDKKGVRFQRFLLSKGVRFSMAQSAKSSTRPDDVRSKTAAAGHFSFFATRNFMRAA
ncbi:hypothetical protein [Thalassovita aquimarina]|uniref:Uncharacterized protein n=1 Tax=Thalassovita aquimarina TaxID=2785917 RepID=A0ABS5HPK6_9RHOB|nr:hypothetical protein [Thalassovita aquimarina]MBR9650518.1 hypothetical protein [Thalassovita aquimarina]